MWTFRDETTTNREFTLEGALAFWPMRRYSMVSRISLGLNFHEATPVCSAPFSSLQQHQLFQPVNPSPALPSACGMAMGLYGALRVLVCGWQGLLPERWTVAAVRTSHARMPLLPKPAMLLSDCSVCQPDAVWKAMCCLKVLPCTAPQTATALGIGLQLGVYLRWGAMCLALWPREAGHCAGIATGAGMRA